MENHAELEEDIPPIPNKEYIQEEIPYSGHYPHQYLEETAIAPEQGTYFYNEGQQNYYNHTDLDAEYYPAENEMYPQPQYANFYPAAIGVDNEEFPVDHQVYMNQVPIPEQIAAETMHFRNSRIVDSSTGEQLESFHAQNAPSSYALPYTEANNSFAMHSSKMPTNNVNRNMSMLPATPANQGPVALLKDEYHDEKSLDRQRFCFCFRRRWQCVSFFAFLLITIGVLIYLSIPGLPNFTVSDPYIPVGGAGLQIVQNPAAVTLNINEDYSVYSPSYFTWAIRQLKVDLTLKNTNGQLIPEARGFSTLQDLRFVGRSTTNFTVPLLLRYVIPDGFNPDTDPVVQVLTGCTANPPKKIGTQVKITLDISSISWIGIKPSFQYDFTQKCPEGLQAILPLIQEVTTS